MNVDTSGFLRWSETEPERAEEMTRFFKLRGSQMTIQEMRQQAPERTGFLKTTVGADFTPEGFTVYPGAPYASIVEKGSKPHEIKARSAKALAFKWEGAFGFLKGYKNIWFFKRVQHPGFPGRRFVERTREIVKPKLFRLMQRLWRQLHER